MTAAILRNRMVVLFSTLGFTPKLAIAPLRHHPEIHEMHVFFGPPTKKETQETLQELRVMAKAFDVRVVEHSLPDAFEYGDVLRAMTDAAADVDEVVVNASGGPRPMIMAATIFCFTRDIPLVYYDEYDTQHGKEIHLKAFRNLDRFGSSQRRILQRLQQSGEADMGTLATEMGLAPSTLSQHVRELVDAHAVAVRREGKRRVVSLEPGLAHIDLDPASWTPVEGSA